MSGAKTSRDLKRHFRNRLGERYGLHTDPDAVSAMIRRGQALHVFSESLTRTHFDVILDGKTVRVVYNKKLGSVVTALPHPGVPQ